MWLWIGLVACLALACISAGECFHFPVAKNAWWETGLFGIFATGSVGFIIALL